MTCRIQFAKLQFIGNLQQTLAVSMLLAGVFSGLRSSRLLPPDNSTAASSTPHMTGLCLVKSSDFRCGAPRVPECHRGRAIEKSEFFRARLLHSKIKLTGDKLLSTCEGEVSLLRPSFAYFYNGRRSVGAVCLGYRFNFPPR